MNEERSGIRSLFHAIDIQNEDVIGLDISTNVEKAAVLAKQTDEQLMEFSDPLGLAGIPQNNDNGKIVAAERRKG